MIRIISAVYGGKDVTQLVINKYLKNNIIQLGLTNESMGGDPQPYVVKQLILEIEEDGQTKTIAVNEGENFTYPKQKYTNVSTLLLTSCNRIDQILLAIAVNKEIIKDPFNLVVADCSTDELSPVDGILMHRSDDPYNLIDSKNYNSNWKLIEQYVKTVPKIKSFQMIHMSPRMSKQMGEANLTSYGITAGANLGSKYLLKLSGVCHLTYDVFAEMDSIIGERSVATWKRTGFNQRSTRVFACNPSKFGSKLLLAGWSEWVHEYDFIERKLERVITDHLPESEINHLPIDERSILVDEGVLQLDYRKIIDENIRKHGLENSTDPIIRRFYNNEIW